MSYCLDRLRAQIVQLLAAAGLAIEPAEIRDVEPGHDYDLAVPVFRAAKSRQTNPAELARETATRLESAATPFAAIRPAGGYINFSLDPARLAADVFADYSRAPEDYGRRTTGSGRTIIIDYSSPNIAKPFSVGHLRSTIIGQALHNILTFLGWRVIGDNHLGDWGTQFGKLLCAWSRWGDEKELERNPTEHLLALYVRFHDEAARDPALEPEARDWFRRLETGDPAARNLWQRFVSLSTAEFERIYNLLGVRFDTMLGESFYESRLEGVIARALASGVAREEIAEDGSGKVVLIPLDAAGIKTPLLLRKSDGTSLYATREIATAEYRIETWHPEKMLYVVGNEQELYFRQFRAALALLGHPVECVHVNFGLIRLPAASISPNQEKVTSASGWRSKSSRCRASLLSAHTSSWSRMAINRPRATRPPAFNAPGCPWFDCRNTRRRGSRNPARTSGVWSVDPSSITISSKSVQLCRSTESRAGSR